uniref:Uncharacterized protein n=1 Tax=Glossina pallidipes TaxID=7398 RepID=A0A1A9ZAP0_GLOPL
MISSRNLSVNVASRYLRTKAIDEEALPTNVTSTASGSSDVHAELLMRAKNICPICAKPRSGSVSKNINNITNVNSHNYRNLGGGDTCGDVGNIKDNVNANIHNFRQTISKKPKLTKLGSGAAGLKRVSFGSCKDSMLETLVFQNPSSFPLSEHLELNLEYGCDGDHKTPTYNRYTKVNANNIGIEVQEASERSVVSVSTYESRKRQHIFAPKYFKMYGSTVHNRSRNFNRNFKDTVTTPILSYNRQQSTDYGWDNPFRPGGDLSREADEIVKTINDGKLITPTKDQATGITKAREDDTGDDKVVLENVANTNVAQNQSAQNDTTCTTQTVILDEVIKSIDNNDMTSLAQLSKQLVPVPISASDVIVNKKKGCCVIQ